MDGIRNGTKLDLSSIFKGGKFKPVATSYTKQRGYYPNELWHSPEEGVTLIVSRKSTRPDGDFSLNAKALHDMVAGVQSGGINQAYVIFAEQNGFGLRPLKSKSVDEMAEYLSDVTPEEGKHGLYWWIARDLEFEDGYVPDELLAL